MSFPDSGHQRAAAAPAVTTVMPAQAVGAVNGCSAGPG